MQMPERGRKPTPALLLSRLLRGLSGFGNVYFTRLFRFGHFAHQFNVQQAIIQMCARNLNIVSQLEVRSNCVGNAAIQKLGIAIRRRWWLRPHTQHAAALDNFKLIFGKTGHSH